MVFTQCSIRSTDTLRPGREEEQKQEKKKKRNKKGNAITGFAGRAYVSNTRYGVWLTLTSRCMPMLVSAGVALTWRQRRSSYPFPIRE